MIPAVQHLNTRPTPDTTPEEPLMAISVRTTFKHETILPTDHETGATDTELEQARTVAQQAYREAHGMPAESPLPEGGLRWHAVDGAIVGIFEAQRQQA